MDEFSEEVLQQILNAIPIGKKNRIIADKIVEQVNIKIEKRTQQPLRRAIRILRLEGHPILADSKGFWITNNREEIKEYIRSLKARSDQILETREAMINAILENNNGQVRELSRQS